MRKNLSIILIFFFLFFLSATMRLDPDFGWHIRIGQIILQTRHIPFTDPFSYTMPSYHFVYTEWLTEVLFAFLYPKTQMIALGFLFSLLAIGAVVLQLKSKRFLLTPFLLVTASLFYFFRINPQIISWFFFSLVFYIIKDSEKWRRYKWFLPIIFLLWANMHGGFAVGIAVLGISVFGDVLIKKKIVKSQILIFLLCVLATCIGPNGIGVWEGILVQIRGMSGNRQISEWAPTFYVFNIPLWFYVTFSSLFVWRYRKNFKITLFLLYWLLLIFGIAAIRNMPFFLIASIPYTALSTHAFYEQVRKKAGAEKRFWKANKIFIAIALVFIFLQSLIYVQEVKNSREENAYPKNAIVFLKHHLPRGNLFSSYGWGGYLIWKLPEKKVFVDGRMSPWQTDKKNNETDNAFRDYNDIKSGKTPFLSVADKYHIDTVLLPRPTTEKKTAFGNFSEWLDSLFSKKKQKRKTVIEQLKTTRWKKVYEDTVAVVYKK